MRPAAYAFVEQLQQTEARDHFCVVRCAAGHQVKRLFCAKEAVFKAQKDIPNEQPAEKLLGIAKDAGADPAKVKECFDKGETKALVDASMAEAEEVGVNSTPTFFVNGKRLSGAQSLEAFKALIDPELAKAGKS